MADDSASLMTCLYCYSFNEDSFTDTRLYIGVNENCLGICSSSLYTVERKSKRESNIKK